MHAARLAGFIVRVGITQPTERQFLDPEPPGEIAIELVQQLDGPRVRLGSHATGDRRDPSARAAIELERVEPDWLNDDSAEGTQPVLQLAPVLFGEAHGAHGVPNETALIRGCPNPGEPERFGVDLLSRLLKLRVCVARA